jgi:hypothetical protein
MPVYTIPPVPDQGQPRPPRARRRQLRREASWTTAQELDQLSREGLQAFSAELGLRRLEELLVPYGLKAAIKNKMRFRRRWPVVFGWKRPKGH